MYVGIQVHCKENSPLPALEALLTEAVLKAERGVLSSVWGLQVTNNRRSVAGGAGVTGTDRDKLWEAWRCLQPCQEFAGTPRQDALAMRKVTQETLRFPERWQGMTKSDPL